MEYYTYAYLREDGTPYYIGKGKGFRLYVKKRIVPLPSKDRIIYLKRNLTEQEAIEHEIYMIAVYGRSLRFYRIKMGRYACSLLGP